MMLWTADGEIPNNEKHCFKTVCPLRSSQSGEPLAIHACEGMSSLRMSHFILDHRITSYELTLLPVEGSSDVFLSIPQICCPHPNLYNMCCLHENSE